MSRKVIKLMTVILVVPIIFMSSISNVAALTFFTNYNGIEMTEEEYETLLNLGFNEKEIYYMTEEIYKENKDLDATLLGSETKYIKTVYPTFGRPYSVEVTEDEYTNYKASNMRGTVTTTYKTMVSSISANGNKYRYKVTVTWNNMPSNRSYDIIGVGYSDNVYIDSFIYFNYYYYNTSGQVTNSSTYYNEKSTSTGGSKVYLLPSGTIVGLGATLYYDVSKNTNNTITSLNICGDYAHATSNVNASQISHYSIGYGGIGLYSDIINKYDAIPCAYTNISVNW